MKQLWQGIKSLPNLRNIDLSHSKDLIKMPDFKGVPNLERLNLEKCTNLVQIHPSIGDLTKLVDLNLKNCTSLASLPSSILGLGSLEVLNLSGCSKLFNYQHVEKPRHVKRLKLDKSEGAIQCRSTFSTWERLLNWLPFRFFFSKRHDDSVGLLLPTLACLKDLDLSFCHLFQIPDAITGLPCLECLNLSGNHFGTLPSSFLEHTTLDDLKLQHCTQLKYFSECPSRRKPYPCRMLCSMLSMYNCPKLLENERGSSIALSWIRKRLQVVEEFHLLHDSMYCDVPGTQIPRWFNCQNVGDSISIKPSPIVNDSNCIGFAFCALFVTTDVPTYGRHYMDDDSTNYYRWRGRTDYTVPVIFFNFLKGEGSSGPIIHELNEEDPLTDDEEDPVTDERSHLFLRFVGRDAFTFDIEGESEGDFLLKADSLHSLGLRVQVKSIGWRWVFKQDIEELQSNPTMMLSNDFRGDGPVLSLEYR